MKPECLASSSSGNCFIFEFDIKGVPTYLMVECGIPIRNIYNKLNEVGIEFSNIVGCLITHAHGDHCCAARDISKRGIPLFASKETLSFLFLEGKPLELEKPNKIVDGLFVWPFAVDHDIEGSLGFIIKTAKETVLFINDHKKWYANLINFKPDYVFIECNYDHKTVYAQMHDLERKIDSPSFSKKEKKEFEIKLHQHQRNTKSHSSLLGTLKGLSKINLKNCKEIILLHLSDRYANEYRMKSEINFATHIPTAVALKGGGIK